MRNLENRMVKENVPDRELRGVIVIGAGRCIAAIGKRKKQKEGKANAKG